MPASIPDRTLWGGAHYFTDLTDADLLLEHVHPGD